MSGIGLTLLLNILPSQPPAFAGETFSSLGCIEYSTVTVESESCQSLECLERSPNGTCRLNECKNTLRSKTVDSARTGCNRTVNCGKNAYFLAGPPDEPETESSEECTWRPCVETDPDTGNCESYQCLSKRTIQTERVQYSKALCVKIPYSAAPLPPPRETGSSGTAGMTEKSYRHPPPIPEGSASQAVRSMLDAAARYKDEYAAGITPEERASRKAAGDRLSAAWDYRAMARAILGGHWKTMKPAERKEYLALLPSMIRKYRYPQMSENLNGALDIKILGERGLKSAGTAVRTRVIHKNAGISVSPELYLRRTNTGWVIYDIRSDGESLFLIYREMHKTIIKENGVSALLNAMKQKL